MWVLFEMNESFKQIKEAMGKKCYAAIDIGSNAARLLIKREEENENLVSRRLAKVLLLRVPLRLGFDVFALGKLSDERIVKMRRLMKAYRQLMKIYEVTDFRACATSAMRDAKNGKAVINKILKDTGIHIEIIDGQEEARMIYNNHVECLEDRTGNFLYVDVGGGSTELNLMINGELVQSLSYNIGTVRILSGAVKQETWVTMEDDLRRLTSGFPDINIIGSGGNINKLYRMATDKDKKTQRLPIASLQQLYDRLKPLTPEQRMKDFSLKEDRADVIVPAAEIFLFIARIIQAEYIHVPVIGLADGIIDALYLRDQEKKQR